MVPSTSSDAPKTPLKRLNFSAQKLVNTAVGFVALVEEVDDDDIVLLAVPMAPTDALLDPLRVPGQVVIHHERAELQIDALGRRFRGDHHRGIVPEMLDKGRAAIHGAGAGDSAGVGVGFNPAVNDLPGLRVGVRAVEQDDLPAVAVGFKEVLEVVLGAAGFGEDERLAVGSHLRHFGEADFQGLEQRPALGVDADAACPLRKAGEFADFGVE